MNHGDTETRRQTDLFRIRECLLIVPLAVFLSGCATAHKAGDGHWMDFFTPVEDPSGSVSLPSYGMERIESDYQTLVSLARELDALSGELAVLKRSFVYRETPYLSDQDNKQVEFLLFRFMNARDALWEMGSFYRQAQAVSPDVHTRGSILGMSAGLNLIHYSSRFVALLLDEPDFVKLVNAAHPRYEIPEGMYDTLADSVTTIEHLELVEVAWYLFCKSLSDPTSALSRVRDGEPRFAGLIARMDELHAGAHIQTGYILHVDRSPIPEIVNRLEHSQIARVSDQVSRDMRRGLYKVRGLVFKDVARIKNPGILPVQFSDVQVRQIKDLLQPGDILLTYTAGYMSNVFLPGSFKHGITYIGSVEDRRGAGLTDAVLTERAVSGGQREALIKQVQIAETRDGQSVDVVEAVAEGVVMNSLDEILATHINRVVVIRPRFTQEERLQQLVTLLKYVGAEYDFKFDFQDDSFQCCTELIYRTTNDLGPIDYPLAKTKGLWVLAADDILRYFLAVNPDAFDFVLLAEEDPDGGAVLRLGSDGLLRLHDVMEIETGGDEDNEG